MLEEIIKVERVSKKFCRDLKTSLWYGSKDLMKELFGFSGREKYELRSKEFMAVQDVSFSVKRGECLALIGPNGSGKSTILKMINGLIKPDHGKIRVSGRVGALIELGSGFNPLLTGRENIYVNSSVLGMSKKETDLQLDAIIDFSGIEEFIDSPVKNYSSGMRVRLGFAIAAQLDPDVLLIDEVLAVGDAAFRQKCYNKIKSVISEGVAAILVTHNMIHAYHVCSSGLVLNNGKSDCYGALHDAVCAYERITSSVSTDGDQEQTTVRSDIEFVKGELLATNELPCSQFNTGDSFTLRIHYKSKIECNITCILSLVSYDLGNIFNTSNGYSGTPLQVDQGEGFISIEFYEVPLMTGEYYFNVWFNDEKDQEHFFLKYNAVQFRIATPGYHANYFSGKFRLAHDWLKNGNDSKTQERAVG
jgi:lipopolysaccharide transport system ATP-binding protein